MEAPAWTIGQPLQHLRVFAGGVIVEDGMDDLAGGNGALDGAEEGDELGVRVLELSIDDFLHSDKQKQIAEETVAAIGASELWPGKIVTGDVLPIFGPRLS